MKPKKHTLYTQVKGILEEARNTAVRAVNFSMVIAYWEIGKRIVENEQKGKVRAEYGQNILKELAAKLTKEFGKGFDERELRKFRQLYLVFGIRGALRPELSWTHYRLLIRVESAKARAYYLDETIEQNWSTRTLERQINSLYYQRLLSSRNRKTLVNKAKQDAENDKPGILDFVKDPYVLEFLSVNPNATLFEKELETELINKLQLFYLNWEKVFHL